MSKKSGQCPERRIDRTRLGLGVAKEELDRGPGPASQVSSDEGVTGSAGGSRDREEAGEKGALMSPGWCRGARNKRSRGRRGGEELSTVNCHDGEGGTGAAGRRT